MLPGSATAAGAVGSITVDIAQRDHDAKYLKANIFIGLGARESYQVLLGLIDFQRLLFRKSSAESGAKNSRLASPCWSLENLGAGHRG
jgi:hypothetical protein